MANNEHRAFIAIINGSVWLRGSKSMNFKSARIDPRQGIAWSSKPPAADGRTAVPIGAELEKALRAQMRARGVAQWEALPAEKKAQWGARGENGKVPEAFTATAPHSAWLKMEWLSPETAALVEQALRGGEG